MVEEDNSEGTKDAEEQSGRKMKEDEYDESFK